MKDIFLIILGIVYLAIASVSDLRKREVMNWLSFSLLAFGLAYRAFFSIINMDASFFLYGLEGLAFTLIIAFGFYYGRVFAGGDTKLLIAFGPFIPIAGGYLSNLYLLFAFIFLLMAGGSAYSIVYSLVAAFNCKNFWKKFITRCRKNNKMFALYLVLALFFVVISLLIYFYMNSRVFFFFPVLFFIFPFLYIYAKTIEEDCFIRMVESRNVTVGDWLVEEVKIGRKIIKPYWEGLSEEEVAIIKKGKKRVKIKYGIPFVPSFLIGFILLILLRERILDYASFLF